jgi:hypothetical protein
LTKNNILVPHLQYFSLFPPLKITLKGCYFDIIEIIEIIEMIKAESQMVLNTLTEHNFQDEIKNGRSAGNGVYVWKGTAWRVMVASRPIWQHQPPKLWISVLYWCM